MIAQKKKKKKKRGNNQKKKKMQKEGQRCYLGKREERKKCSLN